MRSAEQQLLDVLRADLARIRAQVGADLYFADHVPSFARQFEAERKVREAELRVIARQHEEHMRSLAKLRETIMDPWTESFLTRMETDRKRTLELARMVAPEL